MKRLIILAAVLVLGAVACKKEEAPQNGHMQVRLTDAPAAYAHVFVEITGMEVHVDGIGWTSLLINPGMYDLLELQFGVDTILAPPQIIPAGHLTQMRMILGNNNYVIDTAGIHTDLKVPSGETSGLKININDNVPPGVVYDVLLDFDAEKSIVEQGNGNLLLKPVIKRL